MSKKALLAVLLSGIWVNASEFLRNEIFLKHYWVEHYQSLGLIFPSQPINGAIWGIWGFLFATAVYLVSRKFSQLQTTIICWLMGFVLMWLVIGNMAVLPFGILIFAIPLSLLETFVACFIAQRIAPTR